MHDLEPLRILEPGREPACEIHGHVIPADRDGIAVHEAPFGEDRDRRRPATHVDRGAPHFDLVIDERRQTARIGRDHHRLDRQMRSVDAKLDVPERRLLGRHHVHVDAQLVAEHAERIANSAFAVEREPRCQRMQRRVFVGEGLVRGRNQHPAQVGGIDLVTAEIDRGGIDVAAQTPRGDIDDQRVDRHAGHALRRVHGEPHRALDRIEIDDDAGPDARATSGGRCR